MFFDKARLSLLSFLCFFLHLSAMQEKTEKHVLKTVLVTEDLKELSSLDGMHILNFITDNLTDRLQQDFVQKITVAECSKFAKNAQINQPEWYKQSLNIITAKNQQEDSVKKQIAIEFLAYGLMYRTNKSTVHKTAKRESSKKAENAKKTSIGTAIVSGIITVATNLLQHFLTKK